MKKYSMLLAVSIFTALPAYSAPASPKDSPLEAGLKDDIAWDIVEGLTTEVGPRQAGTEAEARARVWAKLRQNVAAWAATLSIVSNYDGELKPEPK